MLKGKNSGLSYIYKQRKEPFEYIYSDNISSENISKVGEVTLSSIGDEKCIMSKLIQNPPEKGFLFFTKK